MSKPIPGVPMMLNKRQSNLPAQRSDTSTTSASTASDDFVYDEIFGQTFEGSPDPATETVSVPTGLSDEDDAPRHMRLQFDPAVGFCRNCEGTFAMKWAVYHDEITHEEEGREIQATSCPRCGEHEYLVRPGTKPRRRKFTP